MTKSFWADLEPPLLPRIWHWPIEHSLNNCPLCTSAPWNAGGVEVSRSRSSCPKLSAAPNNSPLPQLTLAVATGNEELRCEFHLGRRRFTPGPLRFDRSQICRFTTHDRLTSYVYKYRIAHTW